MSKKNIAKLIISIALPLVLGSVAGMFTSQSVPDWYAALNKPAFNPPGWIFGPVWTLLYLLMGISFFYGMEAGERQIAQSGHFDLFGSIAA
jgi:tryptophan-rich sensory protein